MQPNFSQEHYWLNINKPLGYSSAKIVAIVKKITKSDKVGHSGTLDPMASGVLPIAVNKATKTCQYIVNDDKEYYFEIKWGEFRDTGDAEGKATKTSDKRPLTSSIIDILPQFLGKIEQIPPKYSAIKINGRRAYQLAYKDQEFTMKSRLVKIDNIKLLHNDQNHAKFKVACGKGTYIRSLARDISERLGVCGYISKLERLKVGNFSINNAISLDKLKNIVHYGGLIDGFTSLYDVLESFTDLELDAFDVPKVKHGQFITIAPTAIAKITFAENSPKIDNLPLVKITNQSKLIGLGKLDYNVLKPINIF